MLYFTYTYTYVCVCVCVCITSLSLKCSHLVLTAFTETKENICNQHILKTNLRKLVEE